MPYRPLEYAKVADPEMRDAFEHANMYLADVYTMLDAAVISPAGECGFAAVLTLCCVMDGISVYVYPKKPFTTAPCHNCGWPKQGKDNQQQRFKKLIVDKLPWGKPENKWLDRHQAAALLYREIRNPLAHQLGKERDSHGQFAGEPVVGKWGPSCAATDERD